MNFRLQAGLRVRSKRLVKRVRISTLVSTDSLKHADTCLVAEQDLFSHHLEKAARGDASGVAWLWKHHHPALTAWLQSMNLTKGEAEDVSSETWINTIRGIKRFRGNEKEFRSWIFTIARRRTIDLHRKQRRKPEFLKKDLNEIVDSRDHEFDASESSAMDSLDTKEAIATIRSLIPPDQAEVILLRVIGGFNTEETAKIVNRSAVSVRVLQHRGLRRLAGELDVHAPSHENFTEQV